MAHTFEELAKMKVADLRSIAAELDHEAVQGHTQMHKAELLRALCTALGIEAHEHHEVVGIDKTQIKAKIRELKAERAAALEARDRAELHRVRRQLHRLRHKLRAATV
jgi:hypothetical protein